MISPPRFLSKESAAASKTVLLPLPQALQEEQQVNTIDTSGGTKQDTQFSQASHSSRPNAADWQLQPVRDLGQVWGCPNMPAASSEMS